MPSSDPSAVDVQSTMTHNPASSAGSVQDKGQHRPKRPESAIPPTAGRSRGATLKGVGSYARPAKRGSQKPPPSPSSSESESSLVAAEQAADRKAVQRLKQRKLAAEEDAAAAAAAVIAQADEMEDPYPASALALPPPPPPPRRLAPLGRSSSGAAGPSGQAVAVGTGGGGVSRIRGAGAPRKVSQKSLARSADASRKSHAMGVHRGGAAHANPPPKSKAPTSAKGKGRRLSRQAVEKQGVELTDAIRDVLSERLLGLMRDPEEPDDVFLSAGESRDFYIGVIATAAPATFERAEEIASLPAVVRQKDQSPQETKQLKKQAKGAIAQAGGVTNATRKRRIQDIMAFCGGARSAEHSTLGRSVWTSWSPAAQSTEISNMDDGDANLPAAELVKKRALWWLQGRRYIKTDAGRKGVYDAMLSYLSRTGAGQSRHTNTINNGRLVLRIHLCQLAFVLTKVRTRAAHSPRPPAIDTHFTILSHSSHAIRYVLWMHCHVTCNTCVMCETSRNV